MSEILIIMQREFLERVRTKAFMISTLLIPLFLLGSYLIPTLMGSGTSQQRLAVVSAAPATVQARFVATLAAETGGKDERRYVLLPMSGSLEELRDTLNARVEREQLDGYVFLPPDVVTSSRVVYRARSVANRDVLDDLRRAASAAVQEERLGSAGLSSAQVAALVRPVEVESAAIGEGGREGGDAMSTFLFSYVMMFLMYFLIVLYGVNVMQSVIEEKTNRISEVIVSSMDATQLMAGKIAGIAAVALLQVAIWAAFVVALVTQSDLLTERFGLPPGALRAIHISPGTAFALVALFLLGFLLYAAMYSAVAASVTTMQEAQQFNFAIIFPLMLPILFLGRISGDPLGPVATALGLIPFTAPVAMAIRIGATTLPAWQIAASLGLLALATAAVAWVAGKIYRVGILSTGKKATLRDLAQWLRAA